MSEYLPNLKSRYSDYYDGYEDPGAAWAKNNPNSMAVNNAQSDLWAAENGLTGKGLAWDSYYGNSPDKEKSWFGKAMDFMSGDRGNNLFGNITMGANLLTKAYMLPTAMKNMELQNKALDKNMEIAQYNLDRARSFDNAITTAWNNRGGLAARSVASA